VIGQTFDVYKILEKRGEGGMGVLYKAHDERLDRIVALKTLHADLVSDPVFREKLGREAKSLARLNHTNIVTIYQYLIHESHHFIVMEYVEGRTVSEILGDWGPYSFPDAARIVLQILDAIGYAHKNGVVHRDIKPSNILINEADVVKVTDFGIAKLLDAQQKTRTGQGAGSLFYMAPEQIQHGDVDGRTDIYALGITLFEMLTGTVPFTAESEFLVMKKHIEEEPQPPSSFNPAISRVQDELVLHAMKKKPDDRFASADEFATTLRDVMSFADTDPGVTPSRKWKEKESTEKIPSKAKPKKEKKERKEKIKTDGGRKFKYAWLYAIVAIAAAIAIYLVIKPVPVRDTDQKKSENDQPPTTTESIMSEFTGSPTSGNYPLTVTFADRSSENPTSWSWDFGDGVGFSTEQNPSYEYTKAGTYTVTLTAVNASGSDEEVKVDYITVTTPPIPTSPLTIDIDPFNQRSKVNGVWIDGNRVAGSVPFDHRGLSNGLHYVTVETSYGLLTDTVQWTGNARRISFFLQESYGRLAVWAELPNEGYIADIYVDGRDIARETPAEIRDLLVGPHKVEVRKEGFRSREGPIIIEVKSTGKGEVGFHMLPR